MRTRTRPTRPVTARGAAALVLGGALLLVANILAAPVLLYIGVLLWALVVLAALVVHIPRRDGTVTRAVAADLLAVGEESRVIVRFDLRSLLPAPRGWWRDDLPDAVARTVTDGGYAAGGAGDAAGPFPPPEAPRPSRGGDGVATTLDYAIRGVRRGLWMLGPFSVATTDPFGLIRRTQHFGDTTPVTVVPEVVALAPFDDSTGRAGGTAQVAAGRTGRGADDLSPRRYAPGDSMRRIHWRATAHRGELMVRQEEQESSPDAVVVLDRAGVRWPVSGGRATTAEGPDPAFERAVSACASIALHLSDHGYAVEVVDATGVRLGRLRGLEDDRDALLVALARTGPRRGERDERFAAAAEGGRVGPFVVVTGRLDPAEAGALAHGGAAMPVLLATDALAGALDTARGAGWSAADLGDDVALAWAQAAAVGSAVSGRAAT